MMVIRATSVGGTWEQAQRHPKEHLGQELLVWVQESGGAGVRWRGHPCPCPRPHPWWVPMGHSPQLKAINLPGYRQGFLAPCLFLGQDRAGGALGGELGGTNKNHTPQKKQKPKQKTQPPTYLMLCFAFLVCLALGRVCVCSGLVLCNVLNAFGVIASA